MAYSLGGLAPYTEQNKLPLITRALFSAKSARILTPRTGIKSSESLNIMSTDAVFQADGCGWTPSGTTTFTQRNITVGKVKVQETLCPKQLEDFWMQTQLPVGSTYESVPFEQAFSEFKAGVIAEQLERAIWQGDIASGNTNPLTNRFDGFIKIIDAVSGSTISGNTAAVSGVTVSNAFAVFQNMYLRIPAEIMDKPDLRIMCGYDYFRLLVTNLTNLNLFHYNPTDNGPEGELILPGTNVRVVALNGLTGTNRMYAGLLSNFFYGTDLRNEEEQFKIWYSEDNQETRYTCAFKAGVQVAIPSQIVQFRLA